MAVSQRLFAILALIALVFISVAAASDRQPLFNDLSQTSSGHALPQRFQEMVQRRRLAQAGGRYGSPTPTSPRPPTTPPATPRPPTTPPATPRPPTTPAAPRPPTSPAAPRYGVYGVYGR